MGTKMIFRDEYTGQQSEIFNKPKFKEFNLPTDVNYTERSLQLIYEMYCRWLNTRHGIYMVKFNLTIEKEDDIYSELLIDYLFHKVQGYMIKRNTGTDKSINMIWNTKHKGSSIIHEGYFLIPMTEAEMTKSPRGDEAQLPSNIYNIFSRILTNLSDKGERGISLDFMYSKFGEGYKAIFNNSIFEMHECGFTILCEIAELSTDKTNVAPVLFRTRYGYTLPNSYFSTRAFKPF
jgi:hypothetical protein